MHLVLLDFQEQNQSVDQKRLSKRKKLKLFFHLNRYKPTCGFKSRGV
jgi:hypothetical protein